MLGERILLEAELIQKAKESEMYLATLSKETEIRLATEAKETEIRLATEAKETELRLARESKESELHLLEYENRIQKEKHELALKSRSLETGFCF